MVSLLFSAALTVLAFSFLVYIGIPRGLQIRVYWLFESGYYKHEVLTSSRGTSTFQHVEWDGDGWGGMPVGDWTGYVVYDPSDSLPLTNTEREAKKIPRIPCEVVSVRRLEKDLYSVVTDMNQFWDQSHPGC